MTDDDPRPPYTPTPEQLREFYLRVAGVSEPQPDGTRIGRAFMWRSGGLVWMLGGQTEPYRNMYLARIALRDSDILNWLAGNPGFTPEERAIARACLSSFWMLFPCLASPGKPMDTANLITQTDAEFKRTLDKFEREHGEMLERGDIVDESQLAPIEPNQTPAVAQRKPGLNRSEMLYSALAIICLLVFILSARKHRSSSIVALDQPAVDSSAILPPQPFNAPNVRVKKIGDIIEYHGVINACDTAIELPSLLVPRFHYVEQMINVRPDQDSPLLLSVTFDTITKQLWWARCSFYKDDLIASFIRSTADSTVFCWTIEFDDEADSRHARFPLEFVIRLRITSELPYDYWPRLSDGDYDYEAPSIWVSTLPKDETLAWVSPWSAYAPQVTSGPKPSSVKKQGSPIRRGTDGRIIINVSAFDQPKTPPRRRPSISPAAQAAQPKGFEPAHSKQSSWVPSDRVNINRATARELEHLPGVGPIRSREIVFNRELFGRFISVEDFYQRISGVTVVNCPSEFVIVD